MALIISLPMLKLGKLPTTLLGLFFLYLLSYMAARVTIFHAVENYTGIEGKSKPRQDYITKRDHPTGEGWEYRIFFPAIQAEERIINFFHNLQI
ncbi:MAG: hypothetical protein VKJ02_13125 [Snowella sp.]|nr:hypothetical protein [Snowella sp.]